MFNKSRWVNKTATTPTVLYLLLAVVFVMYILIRIGTNDSRRVELVSRTKKKLEDYIKEKGFYWSKKLNRYIDDKTSGIDGGSGIDYLINSVYELV